VRDASFWTGLRPMTPDLLAGRAPEIDIDGLALARYGA
jgi:hypothetical protein